MKAPKRKEMGEIREKPTMKMGTSLPMMLPGNPFKGGTKFAQAGVTTMKKGIGVFFKLKF